MHCQGCMQWGLTKTSLLFYASHLTEECSACMLSSVLWCSKMPRMQSFNHEQGFLAGNNHIIWRVIWTCLHLQSRCIAKDSCNEDCKLTLKFYASHLTEECSAYMLSSVLWCSKMPRMQSFYHKQHFLADNIKPCLHLLKKHMPRMRVVKTD
jgi:uncharacterized protein YqcC (DUF446 family)